MSFKPTWNTLGLNSSSSNATTGTLGNSDGSWGFLNEISCVNAAANWVLPQASGKTSGMIFVIKMDNTAYTVNIAAHTGESIFINPTGVSLLNQGDYAVFSNDGSASVKITGGNYLNYLKMNTVPTAISGNITTFNNLGQAVDSGKTFGNDGTNNTVMTSAETYTEIVQQLTNIPNLPVVNFATTTNDSLSGLATRDGVTLLAGMVGFVKNQTTLSQNGFYITASGSWTRAYYDSSTTSYKAITTQTTYEQLNITNGIVNVPIGTVNANTQWQISILNPNATFAQGTNVTVRKTNSIALTSPCQLYVDNVVGNDSNPGNSSFPFATITRAFAASPQFPLFINLNSSGSSYAFITTLTNINVRFLGSGSITSSQTSISGTTCNISALYQNFENLRFQTSFTISGSGSANFENCQTTALTSPFITTSATFLSYFSMADIDLSANLISTNPYTLDFSLGVGAVFLNNANGLRIKFGTNANIKVYLTNCAGAVFDNANLGNVFYSDTDNIIVNAILTSQAQLTALLADKNTATDGYYTTTGFTPTVGALGDILLKQSIQGNTTLILVHRPYYQTGFITYNSITYIKSLYGTWVQPSTIPAQYSLIQYDGNNNANANNFISGVNIIVSSVTAVVMTVASSATQVITGTVAQSITLPNATTLPIGWSQTYINQSSATVTINKNGGLLQTTLNAGNSIIIFVSNISTAAGTWDPVGSGGTIADNSVTNAKLAQLPAQTIIMNPTSATANAVYGSPIVLGQNFGSTSPQANYLPVMDVNANINVNSFIPNMVTFSSDTGGTINLNSTAAQIIRITGTSSAQTLTINLPDAKTLKVGLSFIFMSESNGTVIVKAGNITLTNVIKNTTLPLTVTNNTTSAGIWNVPQSNVPWTVWNPTVTATTSPTYPGAYITGSYCVIGKTMFLNFTFSGVNVLGYSAGSGTYVIALPAGYTINSDIVKSPTSTYSFTDGTTLGSGVATSSNVANVALVKSSGGYDALTILFFTTGSSGSYGYWAANLFAISPQVFVQFTAQIPIN